MRFLGVLSVLPFLVQSWTPGGVAAAAGPPAFTSARQLVLSSSLLPRGYRYRGYVVEDSVNAWDSNIPPIVAIDRRNGWMQAMEEKVFDGSKHDVFLSVQLFRTARGARADFGQFFTDQYPETRFLPGTTWLGASAVRGLGDTANLYHISDESSRCPRRLTSGISFVYGNGIFSSGVCTRTVGDAGAKDLARRLLDRARKVAGR